MKTEQGIASEVFMHITSMHSKIKLLEKLFRVSDFRDDALEDWEKLLPSLRRAVDDRNRLAHYQVIEMTNSDSVVYGPTLEPHFKMGRLQKQNPETYDTPKLRRLISDFDNLTNTLHALSYFMMSGKRLARKID